MRARFTDRKGSKATIGACLLAGTLAWVLGWPAGSSPAPALAGEVLEGAVVPAVAGPPPFPPPPGGPGGPGGDAPAMTIPLMAFAPGLSAEQREQIHDIMEKNRQSLRDLLDQVRGANDELAKGLLAPGEVTRDDLDATVSKLGRLREQLVDHGVKVALEVRAVLSAEQLAKVAKTRERLEELESQRRELLGKGVLAN